MSSDVLRRGCDLQLTFKILQLEGFFFPMYWKIFMNQAI